MQHSGLKQGFHKLSSWRNEKIQACVSNEFLEKIIRSCVKQQYERLQSPTNKCHHAFLFSITLPLLNPSMAMETSSGHILPQCLDQWAHGIITVSLSCLSVALSIYWHLYLSLLLYFPLSLTVYSHSLKESFSFTSDQVVNVTYTDFTFEFVTSTHFETLTKPHP